MIIESRHILGRYYGYPECCIRFFCDESRNKKKRHKLAGTGYIPCHDCNQLGENELIAKILKNRIAPTDFPQKENFHLTTTTILKSSIFSNEEKEVILNQYNYLRELQADNKLSNSLFLPELLIE